MSVTVYTIRNPVPTPEEMAEILGVSPERVEAVRRIMSTPVSRSAGKKTRKAAAKKSRKK
jgi:DNA-directed RNA polymerase sigma subunit (sigma70/sigma32)